MSVDSSPLLFDGYDLRLMGIPDLNPGCNGTTGVMEWLKG